jgi:guanyl-specific ribonuclease Sa
MALAIPGGAPGYDDDKQFGNFITHLAAQASQRLRDHSVETPDVKGRRREAQECSLAWFPRACESVFW